MTLTRRWQPISISNLIGQVPCGRQTVRLAQRLDPIRVQGLYYLATGIWPVVHLPSFMAVTGPKRDTWLVKTFGVLVAATGTTLVTRSDQDAAGSARRFAVASALALAISEITFVARREIRPIYLVDAVIELALVRAILGPAHDPAPGGPTLPHTRED